MIIWWRPESIAIVEEYLRSKAIVDLLRPSNCKHKVVLCIKAKLDDFHLVFSTTVGTFQVITKQRVFKYATYFHWILWFLVKRSLLPNFQLVVALSASRLGQ